MPDSAICGKRMDKKLLYRETEARGQGDRIFKASQTNPNPILIKKEKNEKKKKEKKEARKKEQLFKSLKEEKPRL